MTAETPILTPDPDTNTAPLEPPRRPHLSYSQIDKYNRCSLQWYMKYVLKIPERPALNLARGKAGHHALETDHRYKIKTGTNVTHEALLDSFSDAYDAFTEELEPSDLRAGEDIGKAKDATASTLTYYSVKVGPKIQPRLVEWEFNFPIESTDTYPWPIRIINGRIDLLDATGLFDNKFPKGRRGVKSQDFVNDSWQLTLYDMVFSAQLGLEVPNLGLIQFLPPDTTHGADVQTVRRSADELEPEQRQRRRDALIHVIAMTEKSMQAGIYKPTNDLMTCSYCPYRTQCKNSLAKDDFAAMSGHNGA